MPKVGYPVEANPTFRFTVRIDEIDYAAFTECNLPSLQVETLDIKEGGQNEYIHRLPVRVKAGSVTLRRGITRGNELLEWYRQVFRGDITKAMRTVSIVTYGMTPGVSTSSLDAVSIWTLSKAYPVKWAGPQLKTGEQAISIEELEIAHHGFEVE